MHVSVPRSLAAVTAACTVGLLAWAFMPSDSAPNMPKPVVPPVQAQNVIVIPSPDQVSDITGVALCRWRKAGTADARPPLAAAEYAMNGMSGVDAVAGLYGC